MQGAPHIAMPSQVHGPWLEQRACCRQVVERMGIAATTGLGKWTCGVYWQQFAGEPHAGVAKSLFQVLGTHPQPL